MTGRIVPGSIPADQDIDMDYQPVQTNAQVMKPTPLHSQTHSSQPQQKAQGPRQMQSTWQPQMYPSQPRPQQKPGHPLQDQPTRPPQIHINTPPTPPGDPRPSQQQQPVREVRMVPAQQMKPAQQQGREREVRMVPTPQPLPTHQTRPAPLTHGPRPQQFLYQRPPREMRTHQPGHTNRRYRYPPRRPLHPQNGPGVPWIWNSPPAPNPTEVPEVATALRDERRDSVMTLQQMVQNQQEEVDVEMEDDHPLDEDVMDGLGGRYEARRAQAIANGTMRNVRIEFGRDSHSWLCRGCGLMVDATRESHRFCCAVGWGADGGM